MKEYKFRIRAGRGDLDPVVTFTPGTTGDGKRVAISFREAFPEPGGTATYRSLSFAISPADARRLGRHIVAAAERPHREGHRLPRVTP